MKARNIWLILLLLATAPSYAMIKVNACHANDVRVNLSDQDFSMGGWYFTYSIHNLTQSPCYLSSYPTLFGLRPAQKFDQKRQNKFAQDRIAQDNTNPPSTTSFMLPAYGQAWFKVTGYNSRKAPCCEKSPSYKSIYWQIGNERPVMLKEMNNVAITDKAKVTPYLSSSTNN